MRGTRTFSQQAKHRIGSFLGGGRLDGVVRFLSFRTLAQYPLIVTVGTSEAEVMASFQVRERDHYINAGFASTVIVIFAAFMMVVWSRRTRALDSLAESQARYRAIFDQAAIGITLTTPEGRLIEANNKFREMLGYTSAELCTMTTRDIIAAEHFDQTERGRARVIAGELRDLVSETRYVRKDRSVGWASSGLSIVREASGEPKYFIARIADSTERKRAEEALRNSEMQLREAQRAAKLGSWEWHVDTDANIWSEELYRIFGHDPKLPAPTYKEHPQLYAPESWERLKAAVEETLRSAAPYELDLEFIRPDGTRGWIVSRGEAVRDATGQVTRLRGTVQDITERQQAEQTALEQFKLAETIFNHSVSCFVVLDRHFNFLRVNDAYARACRRDIGEFAGRNHFDLYPSDAKPIFEEVVRTRKPFETFVKAFVFPDQPERGLTYWEWTLVPVLDQQGEVEYLVFSLNEITERTRAREVLEQSLRRVQALSERVMKIQQEERDGIARELHDELGQTLTALKVNLQMLEPHCADGEAEGHLTEALMITGRALEQVHGMILDLRPPGLEDLGLAVVLASHLAKQAEAAGWDSKFETTLPGRLRPELEMACFRVAQEALTNAMRHARARQVWVALGLNAGEVQLSVRDDGAGFYVAVVSDGSPTGGFGLIGMQERVRQLGGQLAIHSAPGRGTVVRASFPCEPAGGKEPDAIAQTHV